MIVTIPWEIYQRLSIYIAEAQGEISGLGEVFQTPDSIFITDIYLLPQICTDSSSEFKTDGLFDFMRGHRASGKSLGDVKLWWHSHNDYPAYWSTTDDTTIDKMFPSANWILSIVGNKSHEYLARVDIYQPTRFTFHVPIQFLPQDDPCLREELKAEVKEKVIHLKKKGGKYVRKSKLYTTTGNS